MLVVILHAPEEEHFADRLAQPIREIGYDTWTTAEVLVGDQPVAALSERLALGGPVIICGTLRAAGSKWFGKILSCVHNPIGDGRTRVFPVRMERDANLESFTWDAKIAECWSDIGKGMSDLSKSLTTYFPLGVQPKPSRDEFGGSSSHNGDFDAWLTNTSDYSGEALKTYRDSLRPEVRETRIPDSLDGLAFLHEANLMSHGKLFAAGVLLFAPSPQKLVQSAYVQCAKYSGTDQTAAQNLREYHGTLLTQIQNAMSFIESQTDSVEVLAPGALAATQNFRFPMVCIREVLANALCHRDYLDTKRHTHVRIFTDRIEIVSPGQWVSKTIKDGHLYELAQLRSEPASRNERLATALRWVKLVETQGSGIPNAVLDCATADAPSPTVISQDSMVKVTVFPCSKWGKSEIGRRAKVSGEPSSRSRAPRSTTRTAATETLREELTAGNVVVVVGAGVSLQASGGDPRGSFTGLVRDLIEYCSAKGAISTTEADTLNQRLKEGDPYYQIEIAEMLRAHMDLDELANWLRKGIGTFPLRHEELLGTIRALGIPIVTTNYDDLLSRATNYEPISWMHGGTALEVIRGERRGVVHLHGIYSDPKSLILDATSYASMIESHASSPLWSALATKSLLFVGYEAAEVNFGALLAWRRASGVAGPDYVLCRTDEVDKMSVGPVQAIEYGDSYDDLTGFLRRLLPRDVVTNIPSPGFCFGRRKEVDKVVSTLLERDDHHTAVILGAPGMGKTTIALAAIHDGRVAKRFADRRFFVRCDGSRGRSELAASIGLVLGLPVTPNIEALVRAELAEAPAALVLDNIDVPLEADTGAVEELLSSLAAIREIALVVTIRGHERPRGVPWRQSIEAGSLNDKEAAKAFVAFSGRNFADDPYLPRLLAALDGVPLAISLMARYAELFDSLEPVWSRWESKRTAMLTDRNRAGDRLHDIAVSYELSIGVLSEVARSLLSALAVLPDGIAYGDLEAVFPGGDDAADELRRRALVFDADNRLRMLAPLRHYVTTAHPPDSEAETRLLTFYLTVAEQEGHKVGGIGGAEAVARLSPEVANLEALLIRNRVYDALHPDFVNGWGRFLEFTGLGSPETLREIYERSLAVGNEAVAVECATSLGTIALSRSEFDTARGLFEQALVLYRKSAAVAGEASCTMNLGRIALKCSDHESARSRFEEALQLYRRTRSVRGEADCIRELGELAFDRSQDEEAATRYTQALALFRKTGDLLGEADTIGNLGDVAFRQADYEGARQRYTEALMLQRRVGNLFGEGRLLQQLGDIDKALENRVNAQSHYSAALEILERISEPLALGFVHVRLARLASGEEQREHVTRAREYWVKIQRADLVETLDREFRNHPESSTGHAG